jgi:hypothetical protein
MMVNFYKVKKNEAAFSKIIRRCAHLKICRSNAVSDGLLSPLGQAFDNLKAAIFLGMT